MPAAAVKGILLSISLLTALGLTIYENPALQSWLEDQRQKVLELLRQIGEELDPSTRRNAEAFAAGTSTPANDPGLRREVDGSLKAVAKATGRNLDSSSSALRRIPVKGPEDVGRDEERRRKGREYLARRNREMIELKERRRVGKAVDGSFDALVDEEGKLRVGDKDGSAPAVDLLGPSLLGEDVPSAAQKQSQDVTQTASERPIAIAESSAAISGWNPWSQFSNPFSDGNVLDRSSKSDPVVSVQEPEVTQGDNSAAAGSATPLALPFRAEDRDDQSHEELTYEEQLAIALSLSEAEAAKTAHAIANHVQPVDDPDDELREAIEASLREMQIKLSPPAHASSSSGSASALSPTRQLVDVSQPLVDLSLTAPAAAQHLPRGHWEDLFDQAYSPTREPLSTLSPRPVASEAGESEKTDELYSITPQVTHARLASLEVEDLATVSQAQLTAAMEAGLFSAPVATTLASSVGGPARPALESRSPVSTLSPSWQSDRSSPSASGSSSEADTWSRAQSPIGRAGFESDAASESESEIFASPANTATHTSSATPSYAPSEISNAHIVDRAEGEDSGSGVLSDSEDDGEGDGMRTPDSWSEVGSRDGDADEEEHPNLRLAGL